MSARVRIDTDIVFHEGSTATLTVGSLAEHISPAITTAQTIVGTAGTATVFISVAGSPALSTLAVKNTGNGVLRLAGAIDVAAGRLAVLPVTSTVTVSAPGGSGSYTAIWVG